MTVINTNTASINAQYNLNKVNQEMEKAMEQLSSGKRINSAADDAAGLAISTRMESQIKGLGQAMRNAADGQALIDTTEGAHQEVTNILQRMRELAVQSSNDTNVASDRANLQAEMDQLLSEIDRISSQTTWNGMSLLDGTFGSKTLQVGAEAGQTVSVGIESVASNAIGSYTYEAVGNVQVDTSGGSIGAFTADTYTISGPKGNANVSALTGDTAKEFTAAVNAVSHQTGVTAKAETNLLLSAAAVEGTAALENVTGTVSVDLEVNDVAITSASITSTDLRNLRDAINDISSQTGVTAKMGSSNAAIILTDIDGDDVKIDAFETDDNATILGVAALKTDGSTIAGDDDADTTDEYGFVTVLKDTDGVSSTGFDQVVVGGSTTLSSTAAFDITGGAALSGNDDNTAAGHIKATTASGSLSAVSTSSIRTVSEAQAAITMIDGALDMVSARRGDLGAVSNRLDHTISNLGNIQINIGASQSRIQDADFAKVTGDLTKSQIMSQAATAMLAQANASKQGVLSLLQG